MSHGDAQRNRGRKAAAMMTDSSLPFFSSERITLRHKGHFSAILSIIVDSYLHASK
ncbi:hypothetical protein HMPREF1570_3000 [Klebsiella oxytoca KA-2]|nr:hypothetical protein HMPREF1570_3000 [Klebsiella oxytoca KA-2]